MQNPWNWLMALFKRSEILKLSIQKATSDCKNEKQPGDCSSSRQERVRCSAGVLTEISVEGKEVLGPCVSVAAGYR